MITFEQLGVDRLFVDESQAYKNLFLYTKMRNVAGLSTSEAQRKRSDMFMKCRYLDEVTGGRGVVFASGTPVSNSMTELYTVMRRINATPLTKRDSLTLTAGRPPSEKVLRRLNWLRKEPDTGQEPGLQNFSIFRN